MSPVPYTLFAVASIIGLDGEKRGLFRHSLSTHHPRVLSSIGTRGVLYIYPFLISEIAVNNTLLSFYPDWGCLVSSLLPRSSCGQPCFRIRLLTTQPPSETVRIACKSSSPASDFVRYPRPPTLKASRTTWRDVC